MRCQDPSVRLSGILRPSIGMVDASRRRPSTVDCRAQSGLGQATVHEASNGIADHATRPGIQDNGEVDEATDDRDVGDIGNPELVGARRHEAFGAAWKNRPVVVAVGGDHIMTLRAYAEAALAHDPCLLMVDHEALATELGCHPAIAVAWILNADRGNLLDDLRVHRLPPHWWAIECRAREAVAHLRNILQMSERRARTLVAADRKMIRYRSRRPPDIEPRIRLRDLANQRRRFDYRRADVSRR